MKGESYIKYDLLHYGHAGAASSIQYDLLHYGHAGAASSIQYDLLHYGHAGAPRMHETTGQKKILAPVVWGIRIQPTFALVRVVRGD